MTASEGCKHKEENLDKDEYYDDPFEALGLAVVHGIVNSYRGTINVDSKKNEGTIFTVYLPVDQTKGVEQ